MYNLYIAKMFNPLRFQNTFTNIRAINKLQFFYQTLRKNGKFNDFTFCKSYHSSPNRAFKITNTRRSAENLMENKLFMDTDVQNNVLLFKFEKPRYFQGLKLFAVGALVFSAFISYYTYDPKIKLIWSKTVSWKDYLKINGITVIYFYYGLLVGPLIAFTLYASTTRFVKYIILHKGGKEVSIVTYHFIKNQRVLTVPTNEVKTTMSRVAMKSYLPMKIKGRKFFYLLDCGGKFLNGKLFDNTVGYDKTW